LAVVIQSVFGPFDLEQDFSLPPNWVAKVADHIIEKKLPPESLFLPRGKRAASASLPSRAAIMAALRREQTIIEQEFKSMKTALQILASEHALTIGELLSDERLPTLLANKNSN
jgi:hypothetical protein